MQKSSVEPEIFPIFQHKIERIPHFARVTEVRHRNFNLKKQEKLTVKKIQLNSRRVRRIVLYKFVLLKLSKLTPGTRTSLPTNCHF